MYKISMMVYKKSYGFMNMSLKIQIIALVVKYGISITNGEVGGA